MGREPLWVSAPPCSQSETERSAAVPCLLLTWSSPPGACGVAVMNSASERQGILNPALSTHQGPQLEEGGQRGCALLGSGRTWVPGALTARRHCLAGGGTSPARPGREHSFTRCHLPVQSFSFQCSLDQVYFEGPVNIDSINSLWTLTE